MPAKNDPKGYYGRLSVSPTATADEIKAAYRRLAKHLHPDVNANLNAAALFKAVNEAYATLSNPKLRTEYDASWYTNQEHQKPAPHREPIEPICCSKCGKVTAQPRSIVFTRVISFWMTWIRPTCGIVCSACAREIALKESLISAVAGWWGMWGLIHTPLSILSNATGGKRDKNIDDRLLWYNAIAFLSQGNFPLAYALARQARNVQNTVIANAAEEMIVHLRNSGIQAPGKLKDPWTWRPLDVLAHLAMLDAVLDALDKAHPRRHSICSDICAPSESQRKRGLLPTEPELQPDRDADAVDRYAERIAEMREGKSTHWAR
jgi:hypothetical protein